MDLGQLKHRKRELELVRDQLFKELMYLDELMRKVGFSDGLRTVKATAEELSEWEEFDENEEAA